MKRAALEKSRTSRIDSLYKKKANFCDLSKIHVNFCFFLLSKSVFFKTLYILSKISFEDFYENKVFNFSVG